MGKIFGISDLPVTIFTTPLKHFELPEPKAINLEELRMRKKIFSEIPKDTFLNKGYMDIIKRTARKIIK